MIVLAITVVFIIASVALVEIRKCKQRELDLLVDLRDTLEENIEFRRRLIEAKKENVRLAEELKKRLLYPDELFLN